jgi:hypothetical protein
MLYTTINRINGVRIRRRIIEVTRFIGQTSYYKSSSDA